MDKPAGVAVHGGSGVSFGVIEQLRRAPPAGEVSGAGTPAGPRNLGHFAGGQKALGPQSLARPVSRALKPVKPIWLWCNGSWPANKKVIDTPLHKYLLPDGERRVRITTADAPDGMTSLTLVQGAPTACRRAPCKGLPAMSLLEVTIKTGRTHQIRVHLSSQGHGIVGDDKYGDFALNKRLPKQGLERMFLHAWRLRLNHPATEESLTLRRRVAAGAGRVCALARPD